MKLGVHEIYMYALYCIIQNPVISKCSVLALTVKFGEHEICNVCTLFRYPESHYHDRGLIKVSTSPDS